MAGGAALLRAAIGSPTVPAADLDLYVFVHHGRNCRQAGFSADEDAAEAVRIADPSPGRWVVVVDGFAVPSGRTTYDYVDFFSGPGFGEVTVADADAPRAAAPGAWSAPTRAMVGTFPAAPRVLIGAVELRTSTGQLVGAGDVVVTPHAVG